MKNINTGSYSAAFFKGSQIDTNCIFPITAFAVMYIAEVTDNKLVGIRKFTYAEDDIEFYDCFLTVLKSISYNGKKIFEDGMTSERLKNEFQLGRIEL